MKTIAVTKIAVGVFVAASVILSSCGNNPQNKKIGSKPFPMVSVPMYVGSQEAAVKYLVSNFWNGFLDSSLVYSQDTSLIGGVTKQDFTGAYSEYVRLLNAVPGDIAFKAQTKLITRAQELKIQSPTSTVFNNLVDISEYFLYGVNSDYRNEEFYLPVAQVLSESPLIDSVSRGRYAHEVACCSLNRVGEAAADFSYTTKEGKISSLHKIKSDYTLVFFSNPGCTACKEIIDALKGSLKIQYLEEKGTLKVLNIYIDEDLAEWYKYMPVYPAQWINAYNADLSIRHQNLYDVRAIPSLYLLDSEKRVILKDAPMGRMMEVLENI